jgi:Zn finger protein HypA/HybF involved in hydrogenase expression
MRPFQTGELEESQMEARCMKCKTQREMKNPKQITMKNGRPATEGTCPVCGTRMFRIGSGK